jgi:hypothetical protein
MVFVLDSFPVGTHWFFLHSNVFFFVGLRQVAVLHGFRNLDRTPMLGGPICCHIVSESIELMFVLGPSYLIRDCDATF